MEQTRQRIIEGALALHMEKGIASTSVKDIAARAGVGIGTIYSHFPTYEDVVRACGAQVTTITRPPTSAVFEDLETLDTRVARLVDELFAYYERHHWFDRLRCERDKLAFVEAAVARREREIEDLVSEALRPLSFRQPVVRTVVALTDFAVFKSLTEHGTTRTAATRQVAEIIKVWLSTL